MARERGVLLQRACHQRQVAVQPRFGVGDQRRQEGGGAAADQGVARMHEGLFGERLTAEVDTDETVDLQVDEAWDMEGRVHVVYAMTAACEDARPPSIVGFAVTK